MNANEIEEINIHSIELSFGSSISLKKLRLKD
jgi:hypothetical protein